METGIWKQLMMYVGMACMMALRRVSFPDRDVGLSDHPFICFHARSTKERKDTVGERPIPVGIPR
jgi:hypothetical protein